MAGADEDDSTDPVTLHCDIFNGDRSDLGTWDAADIL